MKLTNLKRIYLCTLLFLAFTASVSRAGLLLDRIELKPGLVDSDETDFGLGMSFDLNKNGSALIENDTLALGYDMKGEWAGYNLKDWQILDGVNTDPIEAKLNLSFDWLTVPNEGDLYLHGWLAAGYETDDRLEEQQFAGGATLAAIYSIPITFELDLLCKYDWLASFESEQRDTLGGESTDDYGRLQLEALAILRLRKLISVPFLKNLKFSCNYRYFMQNDLDPTMKTAGEDEFDFLKFDVAYEWWPNGIFGLVQEAFVSYSEGQLPTQSEDQSQWKVGVALYGAE